VEVKGKVAVQVGGWTGKAMELPIRHFDWESSNLIVNLVFLSVEYG
jgi:hypothetical protein